MRLVVLGLVLALAGCTTSSDDGRLSVSAAFFPLAEAARVVGGPDVAVRDLTPAGVEPHDLELTPRQVEHLHDADLAILLGRGFQPALEEAAEGRDGPTLELLDLLGLDEEATDDPHVWLDPRLMAAIVDHVAEALADADPAGAAGFRRRGDTYTAQLEALDRDLAAGLATCERRLIVTAHEAFGWLARRYDLRQEAIAGFSPEHEPDPRRLDDLTRLVETTGTTTVFTETLVSGKVSDTLAREAGVTTAVLDPVESSETSYVEAMEGNLRALRTALGCS